MTDNNSKAIWPLNMPFTACDQRPGEQALTESTLFQSQGLRLCCGVTLCDLERADGTNPWDEQEDRTLFDYLVCKDSGVLLAIDVADRDPWLGAHGSVEGLPTAKINGEQMERGDVADILARLETILQADKPPIWQCRIQAYPSELDEQLFDAVLLKIQEGDDTAPTDYGMCKGFVRVLQAGRCTAMCSRRTAQRLPDILNDRPHVDADRKQISFEERCRAFWSGLFANGQDAARLVLKVMDAPLEKYMDGFPNELAQLREGLSDQCTTYGEAAYTINSMLHCGSRELFDQGVTLMHALSVPTVDDQQMVQAIHFGRRVTGRMPDYMPKRYQPTCEGCAGRSFEDRLSHCRQKLSPGMKLTFGTQESFFQGVSILAQSGYPLWLSNMFKAYFEFHDRESYVACLCFADHLFHKDGQSRDCGIQLLYLLLIEPYYLIYKRFEHNRKERNKR